MTSPLVKDVQLVIGVSFYQKTETVIKRDVHRSWTAKRSHSVPFVFPFSLQLVEFTFQRVHSLAHASFFFSVRAFRKPLSALLQNSFSLKTEVSADRLFKSCKSQQKIQSRQITNL